jgi:cytidine deaminase
MNELPAAAWKARDNARPEYSGFAVGAAIEDSEGRIFGGCNVESSSYGLTMCAERVALFSAIAAGSRSFRRIVVVTEADNLTAPCGACRQVLWDFCRDIEVTLENRRGNRAVHRLQDLLPYAFDSDSLR